MSTMFNPMPNT